MCISMNLNADNLSNKGKVFEYSIDDHLYYKIKYVTVHQMNIHYIMNPYKRKFSSM